jgi:poly-gamma-glutamate system protein
MPFRPSLRSIWTLLILAVLTCSLYIWAERSHVTKKLPYYTEKLDAAKLMDRALRLYQDTRIERGVYNDSTSTYMDRRLEVIIGQQFSVITTDMGIFESKLTSANPNLAAVVVDLLKQAKIEKGDMVAIGFAGDYPGANTAVLCACEVIGAIPVTITSVGTSWWGANDPEFTWLDMEKLLNSKGLVHSRPVAASVGGKEDIGLSLSNVGIDLMQSAVQRNGLHLINEKSLSASINARYREFQTASSGRQYKAYINVGGGLASLGNEANGKLIPTGYNAHLPLQNYPAKGVIHMFDANNVASINLYDIEKLSKQYGLGGPQDPLPEVGIGTVYVAERYDLRVAGFCAAIAIIILVLLVRLDSRLFKLREEGVDPDTLV